MENMLRDCNLVVKLQVLSNHGSLLAACINALYLALLDGCVPQRNQLCAVSLCMLNGKDEVVSFPDSKQEAIANASFLFVHTAKNGIVQREQESPYSWECSGEFTQEQFECALELSSEAASQLHSKISNVVS
jgi:ribonuclease PH